MSPSEQAVPQGTPGLALVCPYRTGSLLDIGMGSGAAVIADAEFTQVSAASAATTNSVAARGGWSPAEAHHCLLRRVRAVYNVASEQTPPTGR